LPGVSGGRGARPPRGELAIVLHTHMPYVEGFGTWPFGEEWLWEALATCYLPLLDLLDRGAPLTVSLTPVLCDQLEAPRVGERFARFVDEVRRHTHTEDSRGLRAGGYQELAAELERAWGDYERALAALGRRGGDLLGAFAPHAQWTSAATHAVLPLLAGDAGLRAQIESGVRSHRARFGPDWRGGFWLPECAHVACVEPLLADAGVRAVCVELTARLGLGAPAHLRPLAGDSGVVLVPIDRVTIARVWSDGGYPAHGRYRDYHHHTIHHHNPWAIDGSAYHHAQAVRLARDHAADFVGHVARRLERDGAGLPGGGLVVCALDTELLGHWWYEGLVWLEAVVEECTRQGVALTRLDDALARHPPAPLPGDAADWQACSWGADGDLSTWSGPSVADIAFATRAAELQVLRAGPRAGEAAVRELLALQSSDWAFMVSRGLAVPYARERFAAHRAGVERALAAGPAADPGELRNLAVHAGGALPAA
jgi:1,4-alpha-glucan branching enzyme